MYIFRPCDTHCSQCVNATSCTECNDPLVLSDGKCIESCPEGEYENDEKVCLKCVSALRKF